MAEGRATALAQQALGQQPVAAPWDRADWHAPGSDYDLAQPADCDAFADALGISREQRRLYPAYDAILSCVAGGWPARIVLAATRPRYARLERQAFGASRNHQEEV